MTSAQWVVVLKSYKRSWQLIEIVQGNQECPGKGGRNINFGNQVENTMNRIMCCNTRLLFSTRKERKSRINLKGFIAKLDPVNGK